MPDIPLYVCAEHFNADLPEAAARELFKRSVFLVEVETHTFCNRRCAFCANAILPERQERGREMSNELYARVISDLADIQYVGTITYSRYNEPLSERQLILKRVLQARSALPDATLMMHTNGDYLTREYLDALRDAGLNRLFIQSYLGNNEPYDQERILERQRQQLRRLGLKRTQTVLDIAQTRHHFYTDYPQMQVTIDGRNFGTLGLDRVEITKAGEPTYRRRGPCFIPFRQVYVDWDGHMMPCCNLRSDLPQHLPYSYAVLDAETPIWMAWAKAAGWRRGLLTYGEKARPCDTCSYEEPAYDANLELQLRGIADTLLLTRKD